MRHMADHGMTVVRVFIVSDIENEERGGTNPGVLDPIIARFDPHAAAQFDEIFRAAEQHGMRVVLVAFALGFSPDDAWKSWEDNPYSRARGGPVNSRYEFFESPVARARAAGRIRYLAARYAFSGAGVLAHSAPPFNIDSDELMTPERAHHFRVLNSLLTSLPALTPTRPTATRGISAWALLARNSGAIWLLGPRKTYGQTVSRAQVTLSDLSPGIWRAQWMDDVDGTPIATTRAQVGEDGRARFPVPAFSQHIAARLERDMHGRAE